MRYKAAQGRNAPHGDRYSGLTGSGPLVAQGLKHFCQKCCQPTDQGRIGKDLQKHCKKSDQAHIFLSLTSLYRSDM